MVFSGVANCQNGFWGFTETYVKAIYRTLTATPKGKNRPPFKIKNHLHKPLCICAEENPIFIPSVNNTVHYC